MGSILENNSTSDDAICSFEHCVYGRRLVYFSWKSNYRECQPNTVRSYKCVDMGVFLDHIADPGACVPSTWKSSAGHYVQEVGGDRDGENIKCHTTAAFAFGI